MASHNPLGPQSAAGSSVDPTSTTKRVVLLHTGALHLSRVEIHDDCKHPIKMSQERPNVWSSREHPVGSFYRYRCYTNNSDSLETATRRTSSNHSSQFVHHDVLLPNLPTSYFLGLVFHVQDIYMSITESNFIATIAEIHHLLYPRSHQKLELEEYLPVNNNDLRTNALVLWISRAISAVSTTDCQLSFLTVLVAHLSAKPFHSGLNFINAIDNPNLQKLLSCVHTLPTDLHYYEQDTTEKVKKLVDTVLEKTSQRHWLYYVLYCYPFFDDPRFTVSRDKPPLPNSITDLLSRQKEKRTALWNWDRITKEIEAIYGENILQEGSSVQDEKVPVDKESKHELSKTLGEPKVEEERPTSVVLTSHNDAAQWKTHTFCVLHEAEKLKGIHIRIYEAGSNRSHNLATPMAVTLHEAPTDATSKATWWRAVVSLGLPEGPSYYYKYSEIQEKGYFQRLKSKINVFASQGSDIENPEPHERPLKGRVNEDVFRERSEKSFDKLLMGHVLHEMERCKTVNNHNLLQLILDTEHACELQTLKNNILDKKRLKTVQSQITDLINDSTTSVAQVVFLARLLGNISLKSELPSVKKVANNILYAVQNVFQGNFTLLQTTDRMEVPSDLISIILASVRSLQQSWLHLVFYTYPALTAKHLCSYHQSWKSPESSTLDKVSQEKVLSVCCSNCKSKDEETLLVYIFQSTTHVDLLLSVLQQHSHLFTDQHGEYKRWIKSAMQKQMQCLGSKSVEGMRDILKTVAESNVRIMELLTRELVFEGLAHGSKWSTDATEFMKTLFSDDTFWETQPNESLSSSFLKVLKKILTQSGQQAGIDSILSVMAKRWITNWSSLQDLGKLFKDGFDQQLRIKGNPKTTVHKMYIFLSTMHSITWLKGLPELVASIDKQAMEFVQKRDYLCTLLDFVFTCPTDKHKGHAEQMELMTKHIIRTVKEKKMSPQAICKLLFPHATDGKLDVHSQCVVDVLKAFIQIVPQVHDNVFNILKHLEFWKLVFKAKGKVSDALQNQEGYQATVKCLQTVARSFLDMSVTVQFVKELFEAKVFDSLLSLCQIVSCQDEESAKHLERSFHNKVTTMETHEQLLHHIESFIIFYKKLVHNPCPTKLEAIQLEVTRKRQDIAHHSDVRFKDLSAEKYWGVLQPIVETAGKVQTITTSKMFSNICLRHVESEVCGVPPSKSVDSDNELVVFDHDNSWSSTSSEGEDTDCESDDKSLEIASFAKLILTKSLPLFCNLCSEIAQGCHNISVDDITCLLVGVQADDLSRELDKISKFADRRITDKSKDYFKSWVKLDIIGQYAKQLQSLFRTFEVPTHVKSALLRDVETVVNISEPANKTVLLQEIYFAITRIEEVDKLFNDEDWMTISELIHSEQLIQFLKPIIDDDLRNLTDAVEERSDSFVNESTVSDLIEVQRFMGSFLRIGILDTPDKLIDAIAESKRLGIKNVSEKIRTCNQHFHALKNLYTNIAQRGEMTKKVIKNALMHGSYEFVLEQNETCRVFMTYARDDETMAKYEQDELNDLRSRALLMVNSKMSYQRHGQFGEEEDCLSDQLQKFIQCVDEVNEIVDLCSGLANAGHYNFKCFQKSVSAHDDLLNLKQHLKTEFHHWKKILHTARSQFHYLNYFHSKQLWLLDHFFRGQNDTIVEVVNLFHFVSSEICVNNQLRQYYKAPDYIDNVEARLLETGCALDKIFSTSTSKQREIVCSKSTQKITVDNTVQPGTVFVAELDKDSTNSIPVLMMLLRNTTGLYPLPNHVLFCHSETAWEEVFLLLRRCRGASHVEPSALYALVNVEQLATEIQFMLVDEVKTLQQEDSSFLLAMICCGGCHHHIIDQFSPHFTHQIQGMTGNEMKDCLEQGWPNVEVITSEVPGLGKSEYIASKSAEKGKNAACFEVGGPVTKKNLVQQLLQLSSSQFQVLHVDMRPTPDPSLVDSFIFELLVVGMVVAGTHLCELKYSEVFIEIANTQQHHFRNSLTNCSNFKRHHIEWDNYHSYQVSKEINSPVQVVCHYLRAVKDGTLDSKEIYLTGPSRNEVLSDDQCRELLRENFSLTSKMAFTSVDMFLNVLATELKKMSASHFFTTRSLQDMLGTGPHRVRSDLFNALDAVAKEFSSRSVDTGSTRLTGRDAAKALSEFDQGPSVTAEKMVERVKGMVQWADSNHLMVVFNQSDTQTLSPLYRLLSQVPESVKDLFEKQLKRKLPDYQNMQQNELQGVLERICRDTRDPFPKQKLGHLKTAYALTPDNLMKMVLIHMRVKSRVPVVIMGETGCGKTTLITFLARVCEVPFKVMNFHAGVSKDMIVGFISKLITEAEANPDQQIWCFLDEINTCDHLGLLSEIICHQTCLGKHLPLNLVFLSACNPYCLRKGDLHTSGLQGKLAIDEQSKLVYRVHPLPEALMDYVWDYGALNAKDEEAYTQRIVSNVRKDLVPLFVELLIMSQRFVKSNSNNRYCVSLRDISRCNHLAKWMKNMLLEKSLAKLDHANQVICDPEARGIILALAHCYHSRLPTASDRRAYREEVAKIFQKKHYHLVEETVEEVIRKEQLDILNKMELEDGIAKNEALRENVFVVLTSILNRIPVFVVGKPGCSKSLSMQLIRSNLRGPDSKDKYFKKLPAVYVVSYQGSESSTSEGIIKVFEKAKRYKEHNPDIIPVVLLDEIGLAENSSFNPLKVLHSLLEPSTGDFPEMAVVGISNWALDAAKMNRAVHLSRPEPSEDDLFETAKSIRDESAQRRDAKTDSMHTDKDDQQLKKLAKAYHEYQNCQLHANFHGLRDYYSLIKSVAIPKTTQGVQSALESGLRRNFGGIRSDVPGIMNNFMEALGVGMNPEGSPSALDLVRDNLDDKHARHLMLITSGDSALSIIEKVLFEPNERNERPIILLGSRFDDDISEEYNYRILSKIILCMEEGYILVLRDLENVYSSLYDMLNQNYTLVGKKRHCRVALGAYNNPMCQVHQDFRCIVIIDQQNVDYSDPPLLNRFEKQTLTFMDIVNDEQKRAIDTLRKWVEDISTIEDMQFTPNQAFLGYHSDTLPSLVAFRCQQINTENMDFREIADICKQDLLQIASADTVLRASKSHLALEKQDEVRCLQTKYFELPLNGGLKYFLQHALFGKGPSASVVDGEFQMRPCKLIVYTYCTIHVDLASCVDGLLKMHPAKLSQFKSERQLTEALQRFNESEDEIFILQCKTSLDAQHMLLAKCQIDKSLEEYTKAKSPNGPKHACMIVHVERDQNVGGMTINFPWQFNFLCGWKQVTLDSLEQPKLQIKEVIRMSISDICAKLVDIESVIKDKLLWCFSCISYNHQSRPVNEILHLIERITKCPELLQCFSRKILSDINEEVFDSSFIDKTSWQVAVACEHELLFECASFILALIEHVKRRIRKPLFKIVFFLEVNNAWGSFLDREECRSIWETMFMKPSVCDVRSASLPDPKGVESCQIEMLPPAFNFPFFMKIYRTVEDHRKCLQTEAEAKLLAEQSFIRSDEMAINLTNTLYDRLPDAITYDMSQIVDDNFLLNHIHSYLNDLRNVFSRMYVSQMPQEMRISAVKLLVQHQVSALGNISSTQDELSKWHIALHMNSELLIAQLQLLHIYYQATRNDVVELLLSVIDLHGQEGAFDFYGHVKAMILDDESDTSGEFVDANDEIHNDHESETESYVSALESDYTEPDEVTSLHEEIQEGTGTLKFQLVSSVCQAVLPNKCILEKFKDQRSWVRSVNNILQSAASIGVRPRELHYLHFCKDFVNLLALPNGLSDHQLARLGELMVAPEVENVLDSKRILVVIEETIKLIRQGSSKQPDTTKHQLFLSKYFGHCIDAHVETPLLEDIFRSLVTDDGRLIEGSRVVMWRVIRSEMDDTTEDTVYTEVIRMGLDQDRHPINLVALDEMLQNQPDGLSSHVATLCCDLIEECGFCSLTSRGLMEDCFGYMTTADTASRIVGTSDECSLQFVCAVAFLNKLFHVFAEIFIGSCCTGNFPQSETEFALIQKLRHLADFLDRRLRPFSVQRLIVRYMSRCQELGLFYLSQAVFSLSQSGVFFQKIDCKSLSEPVTGYSPMNYYDKYKDVRDALAELKAKDKKAGMNTVISNLESSAEYRLALTAVLVDYHFLASTTRDLNDTEKTRAQWIVQQIEGTKLHRTAWYHLLRGILGVSDFKGKLQLSRKSDMLDIQLASVLLHLATVILGHLQPGNKESTFQQLFSTQAVSKTKTFFLASQKLSTPNTKCTRTAICHCGLQFVEDLQHKQHLKCPICDNAIFQGVSDQDWSVQQTQELSGYSYVPVRELWSKLGETRGLSTASQLVIDFMVHGCLYVASEIFPDDFQKVPFCKSHAVEARLVELWSVLPMVLRANIYDTSVLLHRIIKDVSPVLVSTKFTSTSASDRDQQEMQIHHAVEKVLQNPIAAKREYLKDSYKASDVSDESISLQLNELDKTDDSTSKLLQRSSRYKREPSLDDLRACFCYHNKNNSMHFPFLHLVLSRFSFLKYVGFLPALLRWNSLVSSYLRNKRKPRKYGNKPIRDLLDAEKNMSDSWSAFMNAFNEVSSSWTELTGETDHPDDITEDSQIKECLMPKATEQNTLKRMIKTLQETQNSFLEQALDIAATTDCPAVSFLVKANHLAAVATKPLNQVREKDVILPPSDKCLCYHDINTEYGHGAEISYDLNQIEMDVALNTLLNKVILTDGSAFDSFNFADDLYSSSATILEDVACKVTQEPLHKDTVNLVIQRDRRGRDTFTNDLLQTVEVLMGLLKRTSGDPDATLEDFINKWKSIISIGSPDLLGSIKLKNIVALYQQLEVLLAAPVIQKLGSGYRAKLPPKSQHELERFCSDCTPDVVTQFRDILKRFVFRYLRATQDFHPNYNERLRDVLGGMAGCDRVMPVLHKDTQLCHVVKLLEFFDNMIKHKEEKAAKGKRRGARKTAPVTGSY